MDDYLQKVDLLSMYQQYQQQQLQQQQQQQQQFQNDFGMVGGINIEALSNIPYGDTSSIMSAKNELTISQILGTSTSSFLAQLNTTQQQPPQQQQQQQQLHSPIPQQQQQQPLQQQLHSPLQQQQQQQHLCQSPQNHQHSIPLGQSQTQQPTTFAQILINNDQLNLHQQQLYGDLFTQITSSNLQLPQPTIGAGSSVSGSASISASGSTSGDISFIQTLINQQQEQFKKKLGDHAALLTDQQIQFLFLQEQQAILKQMLEGINQDDQSQQQQQQVQPQINNNVQVVQQQVQPLSPYQFYQPEQQQQPMQQRVVQQQINVNNILLQSPQQPIPQPQPLPQQQVIQSPSLTNPFSDSSGGSSPPQQIPQLHLQTPLQTPTQTPPQPPQHVAQLQQPKTLFEYQIQQVQQQQAERQKLLQNEQLKKAAVKSVSTPSTIFEDDEDMKKAKNQNNASRNYRQRKKDHISEIEQKVKQLSLENEQLRQENSMLKKGDMTDLMRPDDSFSEVIHEVKLLLSQLTKAVAENDEKSIEYLLQLYYYSSQLRSTVIEREVEKIAHPYTQARLALMGYKSSSEASIICGRPMATALWWPHFMEEVGLNEQQRCASEILWADHLKIHNDLKEERDILDREIKELFLKKLVICGACDFSESRYVGDRPRATITPNNDILSGMTSPLIPGSTPDLDTSSPLSIDLSPSLETTSRTDHFVQPPYPRRASTSSASGAITSDVPSFTDKGSINISELLDLTRKLEQLKKNFVKHRNLICDTDLVLSTILTPVQHAKLILRLNSVTYYDVSTVDTITQVWGTINKSHKDGTTFIQRLLPDEGGKSMFLKSMESKRQSQSQNVQIEHLISTYESLYQNIYNIPPPPLPAPIEPIKHSSIHSSPQLSPNTIITPQPSPNILPQQTIQQQQHTAVNFEELVKQHHIIESHHDPNQQHPQNQQPTSPKKKAKKFQWYNYNLPAK